MAKKSPTRKKRTAKAASKSKANAKSKATSKPSSGATRAAEDDAERLREAMEELTEARTELSRLGHEMTTAHRQIEDNRLSSASAREHLRSELNAVRTDLKTALAEAEIARIDRERTAAHAQKRIHELENALARLRTEVSELREKKAVSSQLSAVSPDESEPKVES
ncbi:MAG TPA: hypothetical protein VHB97_24145 [Polyangia bacterium]|nr:hypothetical protein [Polyangia bacterium]